MTQGRTSIGGFTLLELMVVIAIISILASVAAPTLTRQITKAKLIEAQNIATQHQSLVEEHILISGIFPIQAEFTNIKQVLSANSIVKSLSVNNVNAASGDIKLSLDSSISSVANPHLTYSRDENRLWICSSNLPANVLPQQCESSVSGDQP